MLLLSYLYGDNRRRDAGFSCFHPSLLFGLLLLLAREIAESQEPSVST